MTHPFTRLFPALLLPLLLAACAGGGGGPPQMPPQDVSVAAVVQKDIQSWDEYSGRIEAVSSVDLRPRIAGYLSGVHFREGSIVRKGDLLFTIDDREYVAAVTAAEADVARAEARVTLAAAELARSQTLIAARAVSQGELESRKAEAAQAEADVQLARARLDQARLNLGFTRITAPIAGRVGAAMIKPGNLVSPGEPVLTTLVTQDPVHVVFEGDERAWLRYQAQIRRSDLPEAQDATNEVRIALADEQDFAHVGRLDFVDNRINPATGTIRARAVLANPDGRFTPGLFARVRLLGANAAPTLLIHEQAVMTDQDRKYVWLVDANGAAARQDINLGDTFDGLRVVTGGLKAGDRVVVNGVRKIFFPGQPLKPRDVPMADPNQPAPQAPAAPAPAGG